VPRLAAAAVRVVAVVAVVTMFASGCAQTVSVRTDPALSTLRLNDTDLGAVPDEGREVDVRPSMDPLRYVVEKDGERREGVIERGEIDWLWVGLGIGGVFLCAPTLALAGACLANPALAVAMLGCVFGGNLAACASVLATPAWLTLPVAGLGFGVGLTPFVAVLFAARVPDELVFSIREQPPSLPPTAPQALREEQAW